jgi:hypothetical protein
VLVILSIPSLWKWWMVAKLKLWKNLVHIFVLYAFLNLLVYFENKSLKYNFVGSKCLWPILGCWLVWYGATMLICYISKYGEILGWFLFENKTKQVPRWSYYLAKPYVDINAQNLLHMLACDPLSFVKLLWPLVESFHASMIEITYTHIYMLTPTSGVRQNMPSIYQK